MWIDMRSFVFLMLPWTIFGVNAIFVCRLVLPLCNIRLWGQHTLLHCIALHYVLWTVWSWRLYFYFWYYFFPIRKDKCDNSIQKSLVISRPIGIIQKLTYCHLNSSKKAKNQHLFSMLIYYRFLSLSVRRTVYTEHWTLYIVFHELLWKMRRQ